MRVRTLIDNLPSGTVLNPSIGAERKLASLEDGIGRQVTYLRLSVTDRCDLRCNYCMPKQMTFLPKNELLSFNELHRIAQAFMQRGVRKIRLTGGEPLVRREIMKLVETLGTYTTSGALDELTLTTNGTQLEKYADRLFAAGIRRINVSLDHLDPEKYRDITRGGDVTKVLSGIEAASKAGLKIKINAVAMTGLNLDHIDNLMQWAHGRGHDLSVIETMPLGDSGTDRAASFANLKTMRSDLENRFSLASSTYKTSGPSRYFDVKETGGRIGFISPLSDHFCATCNRVRLTCTGQLYACLGHESAVDLRGILRAGGDLNGAIDKALHFKPERHDFDALEPDRLATQRHMSVTGG